MEQFLLNKQHTVQSSDIGTGQECGLVPHGRRMPRTCCGGMDQTSVEDDLYMAATFVSVTRRSRSDVVHLHTHSLMVSNDLTDVTLVSDDTERGLDLCDPGD